MTDDPPPSDAEPDAPACETAPPPSPPPEPERYPFWSYGDVFLFFGLAVPALLLGWAMVKGAALAFHIHFTARAVEPLAQQFAGYLFLFGALLLIFRVQYRKPFWRSLGWTELRMPLLWVVICGLGTALGVALVGTALGAPNTPNAVTDLMADRTSLLSLTLFGVTLGPVCEELAFRGFLQPVLVRSLGAAPGIVLAAIPFGLLHYQEYGDSWRHAAIVATAGAAFGCMKHFTGSTKAAVIMHASYNALFFSAVLAQRNDVLH
ncbi:MAG: CPBP family intramembrane glutamic endopeptidase [Bryobacteraceae bacterium]|jgi:membrane protease YdiL (CAAX protease family)